MHILYLTFHMLDNVLSLSPIGWLLPSLFVWSALTFFITNTKIHYEKQVSILNFFSQVMRKSREILLLKGSHAFRENVKRDFIVKFSCTRPPPPRRRLLCSRQRWKGKTLGANFKLVSHLPPSSTCSSYTYFFKDPQPKINYNNNNTQDKSV
jgi:hypothetical protein